MNERELGAVLAGLRLLQQRLDDGENIADVDDVYTNCGSYEGLSSEEINTLCNRLNVSMYTVILLWPDYVADAFGQETYMTSVEAMTPEEAVHAARGEISDDEIHDPDDLFVTAVIEGQHPDLNPGI